MYWSNVIIKNNRELILEVFSEKFIKERIAHFKKTGGENVSEELMRGFINRFDSLKMNRRADLENFVKKQIAEKQNPFTVSNKMISKVAEEKALNNIFKNPLDLTFYTFDQLERLMDEFPPPQKSIKIKAGTPAPLPIIYQNQGVVVYFSPTRSNCQQYQAWIRQQNIQKILKLKESGFPKPSGSLRDPYEYGWYHYCIGWITNNMFEEYRFGRATEGVPVSAYYVYDTTRPITDEWHAMVIQVLKEQNSYLVTNAFNNRDLRMNWDGILQKQPKLANAKNLIVFHKFTEEEEANLGARNIRPEDFDDIQNIAVKQAYITIPDHSGKPRKIYSKSFLNLPEHLQHKYIALRVPAPGMDPRFNLVDIIKLFVDSRLETYNENTKAAKIAYSKGDPNWANILVAESLNVISKSKNKSTMKLFIDTVQEIVTKLGMKVASNPN